MNPLPDQPPGSVLAHFSPYTRGLTWHRAAGGFSGARVWCGADPVPRVALKAWPADTSLERLRRIHTWMTAARDLPFVPDVLPGAGRRTVFADGGLWDCCRWLPGEPRAAPTLEVVVSACAAVAELHRVWAEIGTVHGPCPGVPARLRILAENAPLLCAGPDVLLPVNPALDPLLRRAVEVAARAAPRAGAELRAWEHREFVLQPCVRDLRGEHVLFSDDTVTGIVDYGAATIDHPAGDLARWLGDIADPDDARFVGGLNAYRTARPAFDAPDDFVRLLAHTGAVCSVLGWLVRLVVRGEPVVDAGAVGSRLARLVERSERYISI